MKNDPTSVLEVSYRQLQDQFNLEDGSLCLRDVVSFGRNSDFPVHRWFPFKEGFAADLFSAAIIDTTSMRNPDSIFLDPFCGSGTAILCGDLQQKWVGKSIGIEVNPFLAFVAETKKNWRLYDAGQFRELSRHLLSNPLQTDIVADEWPTLSTFRDQRMFGPQRVSALLDAVRRVEGTELPYRNLLLLGVAAAAERLGNYRRTGRALRVLRSDRELARRAALKPERELAAIWSSYASDLAGLDPSRGGGHGESEIAVGDGRSLEPLRGLGVGHGEVTLITYSPPYLNHIDYTEVYKIELWLLGFLRDRDAMKDLRTRTLRSHASIQTPFGKPRLSPMADQTLKAASDMVTKSGDFWHRQFPQLASSYLADMQQALQQQYKFLKPGGRSVCVIGNSAHGVKGSRVPIPVDLLLADIAKEAGFQVEKLQIARFLPKRDFLNEYLRESILWFRRPEIN